MPYIIILGLVLLCFSLYGKLKRESKKCKHSWKTVKKEQFVRQSVFSRSNDWSAGPTIYTLECEHCGEITQRKTDPYH